MRWNFFIGYFFWSPILFRELLNAFQGIFEIRTFSKCLFLSKSFLVRGFTTMIWKQASIGFPRIVTFIYCVYQLIELRRREKLSLLERELNIIIVLNFTSKRVVNLFSIYINLLFLISSFLFFKNLFGW